MPTPQDPPALASPSPLISNPHPMDPSHVPADQHGQSRTASTSPPLRRRLSMEEDLFYQLIMTARRSSQQPSYEDGDPRARRHSNGSRRGSTSSSKGKDRADSPPDYEEASTGNTTELAGDGAVDGEEQLPGYSTSICMEGVFAMKHEIEDTIKRAEDRHWNNMFVTLNGTALNIYRIKKDWGLGRSRDGPSICPDNPPWVRKGKLERSYSLQHADAGIAADYKKRRYVIRLRAETDQFLLSCIELTTFVKWLECLFAAIDVSAPIDERDFPRDMSIPRIQRLRWFRGESPTRLSFSFPELSPTNTANDAASSAPAQRGRRRSSAAVDSPQPLHAAILEDDENDVFLPEDEEGAADSGDEDHADVIPPPHINHAHRLSTTSYPNLEIDQYSGKWYPEHRWSSAHDLLYAKLCYSNLLFRSPRKSNYIINKGREWFVDWATGKMVRVLPPGYLDLEYFFGPWQVVHTENRRI